MTTTILPHTPARIGAIAAVLRLEGLAIGMAASAAYFWLGGSWTLFAALILAPDLFILGYLHTNRLGAALYNLGHSLLAPVALAAVALGTGQQTALDVALIWIAHIGIDRGFGYGLKYAAGFKDTHLGRV